LTTNARTVTLPGGMRPLVQPFLNALFKLLFTYECEGEETLPEGAAVVAANHPSYLDPILLSLEVDRPIRFMAWDAMFRVPLVGALMRAFGAFPVDVRPGKGRDAYAKAKALLEQGELVGILPEGKRSRTGWMEESLREGAARLSWETGTPLVPVSITGAFRAWPHYQSLPRPARIRVRFHEAIDPAAYRELPEAQALPAMLVELRRRVEKSLLPGVKADLRRQVLQRMPAPWPRTFEVLAPLAAATLVFWKTQSFQAVLPAYIYIAYLFLDRMVVPPSWLAKVLRQAALPVFALAFLPIVLTTLGLPDVAAGEALWALVLGALFPYLYERGSVSTGVCVGFVLAVALEVAALHWAPSVAGAHVALPAFLAAYAWERRTVFFTYTVPLLAAYAVGVGLWLDPSPRVMIHALAGLLAWGLLVLVPRRRGTVSETPAEPGLGLGLR
jgi:1-acyl-sn-glycerol-3-phosphate acyltransferase